MTEQSFGKKVRQLRQRASIGLRELAALVQKSPGYLSDIENGKVRPPSEDVIVRIAEALGQDPRDLLLVAKRVGQDVSSYMAEQPRAFDFLRMAKDQQFDDDDWDRIEKLVEISRIGKKGKEKA
jgi:transcriptional regulator with XRE-family HTH domain